MLSEAVEELLCTSAQAEGTKRGARGGAVEVALSLVKS